MPSLTMRTQISVAMVQLPSSSASDFIATHGRRSPLTILHQGEGFTARYSAHPEASRKRGKSALRGAEEGTHNSAPVRLSARTQLACSAAHRQ